VIHHANLRRSGVASY